MIGLAVVMDQALKFAEEAWFGFLGCLLHRLWVTVVLPYMVWSVVYSNSHLINTCHRCFILLQVFHLDLNIEFSRRFMFVHVRKKENFHFEGTVFPIFFPNATFYLVQH